MILPRLIQLRDTIHSYPYIPYASKDCDGGHKIWIKYLNKMINAFYKIIEYDLIDEKNTLDFQEKISIQKVYDKEIEEGLTLFAEYFRYLWD